MKKHTAPAPTVAETRQRLLDALAAQPGATVRELAQTAGLRSYSGIPAHMRALIAAGKVRALHTRGRSRSWVVVEAGQPSYAQLMALRAAAQAWREAIDLRRPNGAYAAEQALLAALAATEDGCNDNAG